MSHALQLGPLLLPYALLLVLGAAGLALFVSGRLAKRAGVEVEGALWYTLAAGLAAARIAFVLEYRTLYFASPLAILDIRDGGWNAGAGLAVAWLYALHRRQKQPTTGKPLIAGLAAGTLLFVVGTGWLALRPDSGQRLPALAFPSVDGRTVELAQFTGKPVVVNLWATWCPPCVREMPVLQAAQAARKDVVFVFLNQGEDARTVARWMHERGLVLDNVLIDERRQASATFQQQGYPTTLFFAADGRLASRRIGELSAATLEEQLRRVAR